MTGETVVGRQPISIIEIDQDFCELRYGTTNSAGTCPAVLGVSSVLKCFQTLVTCPVPDSFNLGDGSPSTEGKITLRFCTPAENLPRDVTLFPFVVDLTTAPTELNIGGGNQNASPLGTRASVTITLSDHPHHDRGLDPYASDRAYDAMAQGTFWSKWLRRNPYYQGRALRVLDGYIGDALEDMRVRHYIIEKMEGPSNGKIKITAKDPIKRLDSARAQAPFPTSASLAFAMDKPEASVQSDAFVDFPIYLQPAGAGATFVNSDVIIIGGELFRYVNLGSDTLQITQRGLRNTKPTEHKVGDAVQEVGVFEGRVDEVIATLALDYAGLDPSFINTSEWSDEAEPWAPALYISAWITQPTSVAQLIGEIVIQTLCYIWWDILAQKINFKVLRPRIAGIDVEPTPVNDAAHLIADEVTIEDRPEERISQCRIRFGQIDPTKGDGAENYSSYVDFADEDSESAEQYGERRIVEQFCRWLPAGIVGAPLTLASRKVKRYRDTPKLITFKVDAKDRDIAVAEFLALTHHALVDFTGAAEERVIQVTSVDDDDPGHRTTIQARISENNTEGFAFIMADTANDYLSATPEERASGWWITDDDGTYSNGDSGYRII